MPYELSLVSQSKLQTCDARIQVVFNEVRKYFDFSVMDGHRDKETQNEKYRLGLSKVEWPNSQHNKIPSKAVDAIPYPVCWGDRERFHFFAGLVLGIAFSLGINLRWGGDWDRDTEVKDNKFDDLGHFELVDEVAI